jgi:hypothetical protein
VCWGLKTPVLPTSGTESGFWLTPRASDTGKGEKSETFVKRMGDRGAHCFQGLAAQVQMWPTPTVRDWKSGAGAQKRPGHALPLSSAIGGQLNPQWVGWLMGFPEGWISLKPLGMPKFQQWLHSHGRL